MITLRDFNEDDLAQLLCILNDPEVVKYLSSKIPTPYTLEDSQWWISTGSKIGIIKAIDFNGSLVGCIGAEPGSFEYQRSAEIGYWVAKEYWRKGIATHAINEMVSLVFKTTGIVRLFASVFSENTASLNVLEKCNFKLESVQSKAIYKNDEFYDNHVFSILKT
ncbi:GNAT family protein [Paraglaciecola sp.]|uniref:GNAT family N-acetyltransferase n=1 Tax=Paraglaciecola sp. TaxID=1920173 RepID=UPI003266451B